MEVSAIEIRQRIYSVRGYRVVLDNDLAEFYQTKTKVLNQAVQRNRDRFPQDFMFKLTLEEGQTLMAQPSFVGKKHGGRRYVPHAFTEHGVAMLSSVLSNSRSLQINIEIMRAFATTRIISHTEIGSNERLAFIESKLERMEQGIQQLLANKMENQPTSSRESKDLSPKSPRHLEVHSKARIEDLVLGKQMHLRIDEIHQAVADYFGMKVQDLKRASRSRAIVLPRQIAIYLVRTLTTLTFKDIGKNLGLYDHTTAMYSFRKISIALEKNEEIKKAVLSIQNSLAETKV